jgi:hypothetical protein
VKATLCEKKMNIADEIIEHRTCGVVHCGYTDKAHDVCAIAELFGLSPSEATYRKIDRPEAEQIMTRLLKQDMAYDSKIMKQSCAKRLCREFLAGVNDNDASYFTNIDYSDEGKQIAPNAWACPDWTPATEATFDAGIIVVSTGRSGCFWVEDED